MSEYSESFHLRAEDKSEGKDLLKNIGASGVVFEPTNGWVTVIAEGDLNSQVPAMSSYKGTILHYMYAEDHAWMKNLFSDGNPISSFVCAWDPELHIDDASLNIQELSKYLISPDSLSELEKLFSLADIGEILELNPAYEFAKLIGLKHYEWLAGQDILRHGEEIVRNSTGAELINA